MKWVLKFLVLVWSRDYKSGIVFFFLFFFFFLPELSHWPLWFLLPNIVRTYTEGLKSGLLRGRPSELFLAKQPHTVGLQSPGRTPVSTKLQIEFPPLRWDLLSLATAAQGSFSEAVVSWLWERVMSATLRFFSQGQGPLILGPTEVSAKAGLEVWSSFAWGEGWGTIALWWSHWSCSRAILEHSRKTIKWLWPHRQLHLGYCTFI